MKDDDKAPKVVLRPTEGPINLGVACSAVLLTAVLAGEQQELAAIPGKGANIHAPAAPVDRLHLEQIAPPDMALEVGDTLTLGLADEGATVAVTDADKPTHGPGPHLERQSRDVTRTLTGIRTNITGGTVQAVI